MARTDARHGDICVLVVDDDAGIRQVITEALTGEGYMVHAVGGGREAISAAEQERPDLILLDVRMPHVDGWEVLEELRATAGEQTPVVVMTAGYDEQNRALAAGAQGYLGKPFDLDDLLSAVEAHAGLPVQSGAEEALSRAPDTERPGRV